MNYLHTYVENLVKRPRRNRKSETIRSFVRETSLSVSNLIYPLFVTEGENVREEIASMPGMYRLSPDLVLKEIEECFAKGLKAFSLFPRFREEQKDSLASESHREENFYLNTVRLIKKNFPEACIMTDTAMDPYSSDGHDGLVKDGKILNDETLEILGKMALAQARAGADIIGPSDMMDGRVGYIRGVLDRAGFTEVSVMSYTAKYASAFYGPFRDALDSAPKFGDKKTYQMDPGNVREALSEADADTEEGADFLMVKPAMPYLDVIRMLHEHYALPVAAYQVSGEYAMLKAAARNGWLDGPKTMLESLLCIRRAGAQVILTYFAKEAADLLR